MNLPGLNKWASDIGTEEAKNISDESADKGNEIHRLIEEITNGTVVFNGKDDPMWTMLMIPIQNALKCWQQSEYEIKGKAIYSEVICVSHEFKYACKIDRVQRINKGLHIIDWKTKKNVLTKAYIKKFPEIIVKMKLQLASNWHAFEETYGEKITMARDVLLYPERGYWTPHDQVFLTADEYPYWFNIFKGLRDLFDGIQRVKGDK
jgi:acid stress-induced BolA-like protein IbaG/YrbA